MPVDNTGWFILLPSLIGKYLFALPKLKDSPSAEQVEQNIATRWMLETVSNVAEEEMYIPSQHLD